MVGLKERWESTRAFGNFQCMQLNISLWNFSLGQLFLSKARNFWLRLFSFLSCITLLKWKSEWGWEWSLIFTNISRSSPPFSWRPHSWYFCLLLSSLFEPSFWWESMMWGIFTRSKTMTRKTGLSHVSFENKEKPPLISLGLWRGTRLFGWSIHFPEGFGKLTNYGNILARWYNKPGHKWPAQDHWPLPSRVFGSIKLLS